MKTVHVQTSHFIQHTGNLVDLGEYRRRSELARRDSLARQPEEEPSAFRPVVLAMSRAERRSARWKRRSWALDACASLAIVFMTLAFALRVLI